MAQEPKALDEATKSLRRIQSFDVNSLVPAKKTGATAFQERQKKTCHFWRDLADLGILQEALPMPKQPAFPSLREVMKKRAARREAFLALEAVVPWGRVLALIAPH